MENLLPLFLFFPVLRSAHHYYWLYSSKATPSMCSDLPISCAATIWHVHFQLLLLTKARVHIQGGIDWSGTNIYTCIRVGAQGAERIFRQSQSD